MSTDRAPRKRPTIVDVARHARVSKSLVSLVMRGAPNVSDEKRRRVLAVAARLGYRPNAAARSLVRRRTSLIGVLLSDLHNPFFAEVIDGIQAEAAAHGFRTILGTGDRIERSEARALETMFELRTEGLILASPVLPMRTIVAASREVPTVLVARGSRTVDSVTNDDVAGAVLAVAHLVSLGHERIAHIDGGDGSGAAERRRGYERAMRKHGLGAHVRIAKGSFTEEGGRLGVAELLSGSPPTAIFAANDLAAIGTLSALAEREVRVPEDVSVMGYDNTALAAVRRIDLTTVDQPRPDMGRAAVRLLLEQLAGGRREPRRVLMPPSLVVRGSTARRGRRSRTSGARAGRR